MNDFTRGGEHLEKWAARDENNSVLWIHAVHHHQGREEEVEFEMRVTHHASRGAKNEQAFAGGV